MGDLESFREEHFQVLRKFMLSVPQWAPNIKTYIVNVGHKTIHCESLTLITLIITSELFLKAMKLFF